MYEPIKSILDSFFVREECNWQQYVLQNWSTIVGTLHTKMCLEKVVGDMLIIGVYDVHWMQELHLLSGMIMRTINAKLGGEKIRKLRFTLVNRRQRKTYSGHSEKAISAKKVVLSERHTRALMHVKDKDLHEALKKYFERCMQH